MFLFHAVSQQQRTASDVNSAPRVNTHATVPLLNQTTNLHTPPPDYEAGKLIVHATMDSVLSLSSVGECRCWLTKSVVILSLLCQPVCVRGVNNIVR